MPPKNIVELKPCYTVHVDLLGPYSKSIRQHHPGGTVIRKNTSLTCMPMIELAPGWFDIVEITTFDLEEVSPGNDKYIDILSARVSHLFNSI